MCAYWHTHSVGQLVGVISVLPLCEFQGLNLAASAFAHWATSPALYFDFKQSKHAVRYRDNKHTIWCTIQDMKISVVLPFFFLTLIQFPVSVVNQYCNFCHHRLFLILRLRKWKHHDFCAWFCPLFFRFVHMVYINRLAMVLRWRHIL